MEISYDIHLAQPRLLSPNFYYISMLYHMIKDKKLVIFPKKKKNEGDPLVCSTRILLI